LTKDDNKKSAAWYLRSLREGAAETLEFLRNPSKPLREKSVCRAFLRALGVSFEESELVAPAEEPADVLFRECRFQVQERVDHKRGNNWRKRLARYSEATSVEEVMEDLPALTPIRIDDLLSEIAWNLGTKARKYGTQGCSGLDALVYVDSTIRLLFTEPPWNAVAGMQLQGWRSVSMLLPPQSLVLHAGLGSADFLKSNVGKLSAKWPNPDSLFEEAPPR
jgi:hypothetical protein